MKEAHAKMSLNRRTFGRLERVCNGAVFCAISPKMLDDSRRLEHAPLGKGNERTDGTGIVLLLILLPEATDQWSCRVPWAWLLWCNIGKGKEKVILVCLESICCSRGLKSLKWLQTGLKMANNPASLLGK